VVVEFGVAVYVEPLPLPGCHWYCVTLLPVSVTDSPGHNVESFAAMLTCTGVFTVTVTLVEPVQPAALVPVTE
jgi:hypothetical protein